MLTPIVQGLIVGLIVAVVTTLLTVWLALWRFHSEQWWSRKAEAYVEVLRAMFKAKSYVAARLNRHMSAEALSKDEENRLLAHAREGYEELFRASAVDALFLPEEAQNSLELVLPAIRNSWLPDSYDSLEPAMAALDKGIDDLRKIAKKDLKKA